MKCPIDNNDLSITERNGIEIDYCPKCRGVWLDRGELDKIIERSNEYAKTERDYYNERDDFSQKKKYDEDYSKRRKKKSFFDDLFDF